MSHEVMRVDFGALQHASQSIDTGLRVLRDQLDECERAAAPLVATWEGAAQEAYGVRQARWREASTELSGMLRDIKRALDESAADYYRTEMSNRSHFE